MAAADEWTARKPLVGGHVRLEPLGVEHVAGLLEVGLQPDIWRWSVAVIRTHEDMHAYVEAALAARSAGNELPFATIEVTTGRVVGSTRFMSMVPVHRRLEIGHTWLAPAWQRTAINTEAKLMMLGHAFDALHCVRVEFKTDSLNTTSRRALLGIGATEEGTLRNHMITDGAVGVTRSTTASSTTSGRPSGHDCRRGWRHIPDGGRPATVRLKARRPAPLPSFSPRCGATARTSRPVR